MAVPREPYSQVLGRRELAQWLRVVVLYGRERQAGHNTCGFPLLFCSQIMLVRPTQPELLS